MLSIYSVLNMERLVTSVSAEGMLSVSVWQGSLIFKVMSDFIYTMSEKKEASSFSTISLAFLDRFS